MKLLLHGINLKNIYGHKTVINLFPKRPYKNINERNVVYISYLLFSVSLRKTMKKFSSLPLKSPAYENVLNHLYQTITCLVHDGVMMTLCKNARAHTCRWS